MHPPADGRRPLDLLLLFQTAGPDHRCALTLNPADLFQTKSPSTSITLDADPTDPLQQRLPDKVQVYAVIIPACAGLR